MPGIIVTVNADKVVYSLILSLFRYRHQCLLSCLFDLSKQPRRGCFEIREEGGQTFVSLLVSL